MSCPACQEKEAIINELAHQLQTTRELLKLSQSIALDLESRLQEQKASKTLH